MFFGDAKANVNAILAKLSEAEPAKAPVEALSAA